jgi:DHA2 family multidrug resistance protein-like MFS transporter
MTDTLVLTALGDEPKAATRREWIGLAVIALPCLLYAMDLTVLNLAVPALCADLRPSGTELLWIIDIYGFLLAASLVPMGTIGDRIGRRRLLLIGAAAFGTTSVLAAFSRSARMLIAMRALLGLAGATLAPSTLSLIRSMFRDPKERTTAIGIWIASFSAGTAIGPLVGGFLLERFAWGSVFLAGVPAMGLLLLLGPRLLPEFRDPAAGRVDAISAVLSLTTVLLAVYALKRSAEQGDVRLIVPVLVAAGVTGFVFVRRQRRLVTPMVDFRLFRAPAFGAAFAIYTLASFVALGVYVFVGQYMQLVLQLSPVRAGLCIGPFGVAFVVGSTMTPRVARRTQPERLIVLGLAVASLGFGLIAWSVGTPGLAGLVAGTVVFALGLAPVVTLVNDVVMGAASAEQAGTAAALSETGSELGGALGIAVLGSLGTAVYRSAMAGTVLPGVPEDAMETARSTLGAALAVADKLPIEYQEGLVDAARSAFASSFRTVAVVAAAMAMALAILGTRVLRRPSAIDRS